MLAQESEDWSDPARLPSAGDEIPVPVGAFFVGWDESGSPLKTPIPDLEPAATTEPELAERSEWPLRYQLRERASAVDQAAVEIATRRTTTIRSLLRALRMRCRSLH